LARPQPQRRHRHDGGPHHGRGPASRGACCTSSRPTPDREA
jgi:hypothetical protein